MIKMFLLRKMKINVLIRVIQICKTAIKQNALFSSSTASGPTFPVTFLTEDERVMKETGKIYYDFSLFVER